MRLIHSVFIMAAVLFATAAASPADAKPTREQVVQLSETCKHQKKRMDLVAEFGSDFSGLDLSGVDLRGYHAVGYSTLIRNANFSRCNLEGAEFGSAILNGSDFTGAKLDGAYFVTGSLRNAVFRDVSFVGTSFYQCDLSGADFSGCDLSQGSVQSCTLDRANLANANLAGLQLSGIEFRDANLRSADLSHCDSRQTDYTGADLTDTNFTNANVDAAIFRDARGLTPEAKKELEGRAGRWKFELRAVAWELIVATYYPAYLLVFVALVGLSGWELRRRDKSALMMMTAGVNAVTLIPASLLFLMLVLGAHPTVQFNVGNATAMRAWSMWVDLWPTLMVTLMACIGASIVVAVAFLVMNLRWESLKRAKLRCLYVVLTIVHALFAFQWVGSHFPSA